jgi:prepilin-type N-terminal cleavage/methylation domain-containing protein
MLERARLRVQSAVMLQRARLRVQSAVMRRRTRHGERGVTLIELAISLAVLAIISVGILVPLVTQIQQRNVTMSDSTLTDVKDALLGFAAINGRLPCPATLAAANGAEAFSATPVGGASNGECADFWGYVPGRALGVTPLDTSGFVLDAWGNRLRYAVTDVQIGTVTRAFTRSDGVRNAGMAAVANAVAAATPVLLQVCASGVGVTAGTSCNSAAVTNNELTTNAVAVIWSPGANARTTGGNGADEAQNPNPANETSKDRLFVSHPTSDSTTNPFDDVVSWLGVNTLVNRMVAAGALP